MISPAQRLTGSTVSPIRILSDGAPPDAIPLGLGEPTWPMPDAAKRALAAFGERNGGVCSYGPQVGRPELRRAIAALHGATIDEVLVTNGTQEGLFDVFQAYLDPGDRVLVPDPGFVGYQGVARLAQAECVGYPLDAAQDFCLDAAALIATLDRTPRAKLVVLNHPSNPTGGGATREALAMVAAACEERGVLLLSDEVYRELHFGTAQPSLREITDRGIVLDSCSKGLSSPGLRIGWAVGPAELMKPLHVVHGYAVTGASTPAQFAALAMLEARADILPGVRAELRARYDALASAMKTHLGRDIEPPAGSFYHFLPLPEAAHADPLAYCLRLRDEAKVVLIPGYVFGAQGRGHARLSFAARPEQVAEGVRRLATFMA